MHNRAVLRQRHIARIRVDVDLERNRARRILQIALNVPIAINTQQDRIPRQRVHKAASRAIIQRQRIGERIRIRGIVVVRILEPVRAEVMREQAGKRHRTRRARNVRIVRHKRRKLRIRCLNRRSVILKLDQPAEFGRVAGSVAIAIGQNNVQRNEAAVHHLRRQAFVVSFSVRTGVLVVEQRTRLGNGDVARVSIHADAEHLVTAGFRAANDRAAFLAQNDRFARERVGEAGRTGVQDQRVDLRLFTIGTRRRRFREKSGAGNGEVSQKAAHIAVVGIIVRFIKDNFAFFRRCEVDRRPVISDGDGQFVGRRIAIAVGDDEIERVGDHVVCAGLAGIGVIDGVGGQHIFETVGAIAIRRDDQLAIDTLNAAAIGHVDADAGRICDDKRTKAIIARIDKDIAQRAGGAAAGSAGKRALIDLSGRRSEAHNAELGEIVFTDRGEQLTPLQRAELQGRGRQQVDHGAGIADISIGGVEAAAATLGRGGHHGQRAIGTRRDVDAVGLKSGSERELGDFHIADQEGGHLESGVENGDGGAVGLHENQIVPVEPDLVDRDPLRKADNIVCVGRDRFRHIRHGCLRGRLRDRLTGRRVDGRRLHGSLVLRELESVLLCLAQARAG